MWSHLLCLMHKILCLTDTTRTCLPTIAEYREHTLIPIYTYHVCNFCFWLFSANNIKCIPGVRRNSIYFSPHAHKNMGLRIDPVRESFIWLFVFKFPFHIFFFLSETSLVLWEVKSSRSLIRIHAVTVRYQLNIIMYKNGKVDQFGARRCQKYASHPKKIEIKVVRHWISYKKSARA